MDFSQCEAESLKNYISVEIISSTSAINQTDFNNYGPTFASRQLRNKELSSNAGAIALLSFETYPYRFVQTNKYQL